MHGFVASEKLGLFFFFGAYAYVFFYGFSGGVKSGGFFLDLVGGGSG